jgi:2-amino-4-hydroxy-6-hydroxymethyldihydropteridine diphosphokinase
MSTARVFIALGSNLGDRRANLEGAVAALCATEEVEVVRVSSWHETRAVGGPSAQPDYLNGALEARTELAPEDLLWLLQRIETRFGRDRRNELHHGPRTLDLDLLLHGDERRDDAALRLPHPGLEERAFVLAPLAEIAPELRLPRSNLSVAERLRALAAEACP